MSVEKNTTIKAASKKPAPEKKRVRKPKVPKDKEIIAELTLQLVQLEDKQLRLKAEFDNFRRRKDREFLQLLQYEGEDILKGLLPIIDDLERLVEALYKLEDKTGASIKQGIEIIQNKLKKFFSEHKVEVFGEPGETLNAEIHDAMMVRTEKGKQEDEIIEVFEKGYRYKDKVIRHAKVIVNKS